jgi:hypothetical protein
MYGRALRVLYENAVLNSVNSGKIPKPRLSFINRFLTSVTFVTLFFKFVFLRIRNTLSCKIDVKNLQTFNISITFIYFKLLNI